jgi:site-specific DNA-methyltransferase (cytosine-N4-specific)
MKNSKVVYSTKFGKCLQGDIEKLLLKKSFQKYKGKINLIFTSPPFPLNRKKKYGNLNGNEYIEWLTRITTLLKDYLTEDGSFVIEIGNSWEANEPVMSTLSLETLLAIKYKGNFKLCQQFVWFNTAKLPSPVQWVNIERTRVKDSFTTIWWLSNSATPKANNKNILVEYSKSMKKLLKTNEYNSGLRPSQHDIGEKSFLKNNGGAIPSNVLFAANTVSNSEYLNNCKKKGITPHPARMPNFIAKFFIHFLTDENDLVFDPFSGSNTTGAVSESLKRRWLSIEIDENYIKGSKLKFSNEHRKTI